MVFTLLAGSYQILFHQLYLALPAHIQSLPDATQLLGGVFTLSAVIGVLLQLPASRLVERRLGVPLAMGLGIGVMGLSYLALPLLSPGRRRASWRRWPCFPWAPSSASALCRPAAPLRALWAARQLLRLLCQRRGLHGALW